MYHLTKMVEHDLDSPRFLQTARSQESNTGEKNPKKNLMLPKRQWAALNNVQWFFYIRPSSHLRYSGDTMDGQYHWLEQRLSHKTVLTSHKTVYCKILDFDSDCERFLCMLLSVCLTHTSTKMALFKFKGRGLAMRDDSLHRRTAETTDGHSSEGLLPHIRLSIPDPPFLTLHIPPSAFSPDPPLSPPHCGLQQTIMSNPHLPQQSPQVLLFLFLPLACLLYGLALSPL